ncbi:hypothetical protein FA10DRAFT_303172 [Acaromyces ingoldii]|uniref:Uncharacterized protein n=1 Tax=Acaromyces ingoldii TaxID=215250 RepID=A0A316YJB6_9BASI|nr:hypothetical protein FA10DRAFT_303172 [Acaromyces ingoldii]PWN88183.1 hypothetical protein FA10DRAFT_303172 [Acaromyces ingoldii]
MDFTKSTEDPHGVQALLATLRRQQERPPAPSHPVEPFPSNEASKKRDGPAAQEHDEDSVASAKRQRTASSGSDNLRHVSLAQALPHLARLSKDESFLAALLKLKADQDSVEEKLASHREEMLKRRPAPTRNQLREWDLKALNRWDEVYTEQQQRLERLGVPGFYVTKDQGQRKKQERVFQILAGLLE